MAVGSAAVSGASSAGHAVADGAGKAGGFLGGVWNFLTKKHDIPFASKPPSERNLIIDTALDWGLGISYNPQTAHYQTSILDTAINVVSVLGVGLIARGAGIGLRSAGAAIRALPGGVRALEVGSHLARPALEAAGKLARPAAELLGHTGARLGEATGHAKAALGGAARRAWNGFIDVGGKAASKAGQGASWLGSKVSSGLGSLVQRGGQKAAGAVNSAKEVALWSFEQGVQRVPDNFAKDVVRVGAGELKPWLNFAKREAETLGVKIEPSVHFLQNIGQHGTDLALTMPKHGFIGLSSDLLKGGVQQGAKLVTKADIPQLIEHEITHQGLRQGAPKVWEPISKLTQPAKELILENKMLNEKVTDIITSIRDPKVAKLAIDVSKYANPGKAFAATDEVIRYGQKLATTNPSPILRDAGKSLASGFQALKDTAVKSNTLLPAILPLPALSLLNPPKTQAPAPLPQAKQPAQEQKQSLLSSVTSGVKSALSGVKSALSGVGSALSSLIRIPKPQPAPQPSPVPSYTPVAQQAAKQTTSPNQQSYSPINQQAAKPTTSPSISYSPVSQQAAKPTATQPAAKPAPPQPAPPKPTPAYQSQPKPAPQQSPPKPSAPAPRAPAPVSRPAPAPAPRAPAPVSRPAPAPTPRAAPAPSNGNRGGGSNGGGSKGGGSKGRR
ncbi:hypothetical protein HYS54_02345 [Candidatus Micrarchaeota archaeon]|nr:hypothetical protein [Candidatus Micrarchaeota archaeon]